MGWGKNNVILEIWIMRASCVLQVKPPLEILSGANSFILLSGKTLIDVSGNFYPIKNGDSGLALFFFISFDHFK